MEQHDEEEQSEDQVGHGLAQHDGRGRLPLVRRIEVDVELVVDWQRKQTVNAIKSRQMAQQYHAELSMRVVAREDADEAVVFRLAAGAHVRLQRRRALRVAPRYLFPFRYRCLCLRCL